MRLGLTIAGSSPAPRLDAISMPALPDILHTGLHTGLHAGRAPASVTIEGISATFGDVAALDDVSLDVRAGEILCLLGPSGSGKSTLLRIVAGITRPVRGRITIEGVEVEGPGVSVEPEKRRVGMVFQDYALFPHLTVAANVAFGLRRLSRAEADRTVGALLDRVGLALHADRYPHMLSGGERQRVALARALAPSPQRAADGRAVLEPGRPASRSSEARHNRPPSRHAHYHDHRHPRPGRSGQRGRSHRAAAARASAAVRFRRKTCTRDPTSAFAAQFFGDVNELSGTCRRGRVETALGSFAAPHLAEHAAARVCIRPEHLRVAAGATGIPARVLASQFRGEIDRVTLDVAGLPAPVSLRVFGRAGLVAGSSVNLEVESSSVVVVPDDES